MMKRDLNLTFVRFAWLNLLFNLFVIVWGGFVGASGSGDGCGTSWPLCQQLVTVETRSWETFVEFFHRMTSGLALIFVVILAIWAFRKFQKGHPGRRYSAYAVAFMFIESLLGAALVIFRWVDTNLSVARAIVQPIHLTNTFLLMAAIALTAWYASRKTIPKLTFHRLESLFIIFALIGLVVVSSFGTIASLASTIFPSESFFEGVQQDFARQVHFLIRLRIWHPLLATAVGLFIVHLGDTFKARFPNSTQIKRLVHALWVLYGLQYVLGSFNAVLLAPIGLQMVHLTMAHLIWLNLIFLAVELYASSPVKAQEVVTAST